MVEYFTFPICFIGFENPEVKAALVDYRIQRIQRRSLESDCLEKPARPNHHSTCAVSLEYCIYQVLCSAIPLNKINNGEI